MGSRALLHQTEERRLAYRLGKLDAALVETVSRQLEVRIARRRRVAELSADTYLERLHVGHGTSDDVRPLCGIAVNVDAACSLVFREGGAGVVSSDLGRRLRAFSPPARER